MLDFWWWFGYIGAALGLLYLLMLVTQTRGGGER